MAGKQSMTRRCSAARIVRIHSSLEKIEDDTGRRNKSLAMLGREPQEGRAMPVPQKSPSKEERARSRSF